MNKNQKYVGTIISIILVSMVLYPPYYAVTKDYTYNKSFSFIFNPPCDVCVVNIAQLFLQILVVCIVGGITWYIFKEKS